MNMAVDECLASCLGFGLITVAVDDDLNGIATCFQTDIQISFVLAPKPFLAMRPIIGIQMFSAPIGRVTAEGLAANIHKGWPRWLTSGLVGLLVMARTINSVADTVAKAKAVKLQSKKWMDKVTTSCRHRFFAWSDVLVICAAVALRLAARFYRHPS